MPIQKSDAFTAGQPEPIVETPVEKLQPPKEYYAICGHVNKHWTGAEPMTCVLDVGHAGNHEAPYVTRSGMIEKGAWNSGVDD